MVGEVEEFRTKFDASVFGGFKFLKDGKIEAVKARAEHLTARASERRQIGLSIGGDDRRVSEGGGIHPLIDIVFAAGNTFSRYKERDTTHTGDSSDIAWNGKGDAGLQREDGIDAPTAGYLVYNAVGAGNSPISGEPNAELERMKDIVFDVPYLFSYNPPGRLMIVWF